MLMSLSGCAYDNSRLYQPVFDPGNRSVALNGPVMELELCHVREGFIPPGIIIDWNHIGPRFAAQSACVPLRGATMNISQSSSDQAPLHQMLVTNDIDGSGAMSSSYRAWLVSEAYDKKVAEKGTDIHPDSRPRPDGRYNYVLDTDETLTINGRTWRHRRWHWVEKEGIEKLEKIPSIPREEYRTEAAPGWVFWIRSNLNAEMRNYPDLMESRLRTLRTMVESVKFEPLDRAWAEQELERQRIATCAQYPKQYPKMCGKNRKP